MKKNRTKELKDLIKSMEKQIKDIRLEKKSHLQHARICTYNIAQLQRRIAEIKNEIKGI